MPKSDIITTAIKFIPKDMPKADIVATDVKTTISPLEGTLAKLRAYVKNIEFQGPNKDTFGK